VLCSAGGIPRAKTGTGEPFEHISNSGKPKLVLTSQDSFVSNTPATLAPGSTCQQLG